MKVSFLTLLYSRKLPPLLLLLHSYIYIIRLTRNKATIHHPLPSHLELQNQSFSQAQIPNTPLSELILNSANLRYSHLQLRKRTRGELMTRGWAAQYVVGIWKCCRLSFWKAAWRLLPRPNRRHKLTAKVVNKIPSWETALPLAGWRAIKQLFPVHSPSRCWSKSCTAAQFLPLLSYQPKISDRFSSPLAER